MNESEFENELRALRPIKPSPEIKAAIQRELAQTPSADVNHAASFLKSSGTIWNHLLTGLCWAMGGATAAAFVFVFVPGRHKPDSTSAAKTASAAPKNLPSVFEQTASS